MLHQAHGINLEVSNLHLPYQSSALKAGLLHACWHGCAIQGVPFVFMTMQSLCVLCAGNAIL